MRYYIEMFPLSNRNNENAYQPMPLNTTPLQRDLQSEMFLVLSYSVRSWANVQ